MKCPKCNAKTKTAATREQVRGTTKRKYRCPSCDTRFTTLEIPTVDTPAARDMIDWIGDNMRSMAGFDVPEGCE